MGASRPARPRVACHPVLYTFDHETRSPWALGAFRGAFRLWWARRPGAEADAARWERFRAGRWITVDRSGHPMQWPPVEQ